MLVQGDQLYRAFHISKDFLVRVWKLQARGSQFIENKQLMGCHWLIWQKTVKNPKYHLFNLSGYTKANKRHWKDSSSYLKVETFPGQFFF
jgi:hypothetical protein